jgi:hypothetical protein
MMPRLLSSRTHYVPARITYLSDMRIVYVYGRRERLAAEESRG